DVVKGILNLQPIGRARQYQVGLAGQVRIEPGDGDQYLVSVGLLCDRLSRRSTQTLSKHRHTALNRVVLLDLGRRIVLGIFLGQVDLEAANTATGIERLEVDFLALGQRNADWSRHRAREGGKTAQRDSFTVEVHSGTTRDPACRASRAAGSDEQAK